MTGDKRSMADAPDNSTMVKLNTGQKTDSKAKPVPSTKEKLIYSESLM